MKYEQIYDGQWFRPAMKGHSEACCDCSLIHVTDFKIDKDGHLWMRTKRNPRKTAAARRKFKFMPQEKSDD